jgi:hypothetical protein
MPVERRGLAGPGELRAQGIANADGGGIGAGPILDPTKHPRPIAPLGPGLGQRAIGQGRHEVFERFIDPPIASGACDLGDLNLQLRPPHVSLVRPTWGPGRDDHGPHQQPQVQLALPRDAPKWRTQARDCLRWQNRFKHLSDILARHRRALPHARPILCLPMKRWGKLEHAMPMASSLSWPALGGAEP